MFGPVVARLRKYVEQLRAILFVQLRELSPTPLQEQYDK
jgi:hypothetical protein